jgi:hypothetical protein
LLLARAIMQVRGEIGITHGKVLGQYSKTSA